MGFQTTTPRTVTLVIEAFWDEEACVWVATSEDVPGLATEATTQDELIAKLKIMVPELCELNDLLCDDTRAPTELLIRSQRRESLGA